MPNHPAHSTGTNNFRDNTISAFKTLQFDAKIDEQLSDKHHVAGRYSHLHTSNVVPTILGDGEFNDGLNQLTTVNNVGLQHDWNIKPTMLLSSRFAVDRV